MDVENGKAPGRQWRCSNCGLLLGMRSGGEIELRYKDARYVVSGSVRASCRRCGTENVGKTHGGSQARSTS